MLNFECNTFKIPLRGTLEPTAARAPPDGEMSGVRGLQVMLLPLKYTRNC